MACQEFHERIIGQLYGEIAEEAHASLQAHLDGCAACRADVEELSHVRNAVRECEPVVARAPRLIVLNERPTWRPALLAASILGAALVAGASAGGGYALVRNHAAVAPQSPARVTAAAPEKAEPSTASLPLTREELDAALARFERRVDAGRSTDLRYMMAQLAASEVRSGQRIGQTNEALRYVALASNPGIGPR